MTATAPELRQTTPLLSCMLPPGERPGLEIIEGRGATVVEAYPVDNDSPSYRFMGRVSTFRKAGFKEVGRAGFRRNVMRIAVGDGTGE